MTGWWLVAGIWVSCAAAWFWLMWTELADRRHQRWIEQIDRDLTQFRHPAGRDIPPEDQESWNT